jgi:opacity protein-like surface antigen
MKWTGLLLVVGLACLVVAPAYSQDRTTGEVYFGDEPPSFAVSFRASWHDISGIPFKADTYFPEDLDFDVDMGYGVALEYYITPSWSVELLFDHVKTEDTYGEAQVVSLGTDSWALSGKYTFRPNARLRPYVLGGIDWISSDVSYPYPETYVSGSVGSTWGFHLGGGAEYRFTDNLGVFAEVRYLVASTDLDTTVWDMRGAWTTRNDLEYDGFIGAVGLKLYW